MTVFVDTSGFFAALDGDDHNHTTARDIWARLFQDGSQLVTTNYVVVEAFTLVQRRLGMSAVRVLYEDFVPVLDVQWVTQSVHDAGLALFLASIDVP